MRPMRPEETKQGRRKDIWNTIIARKNENFHRVNSKEQ
jgi:hypothetical protein